MSNDLGYDDLTKEQLIRLVMAQNALLSRYESIAVADMSQKDRYRAFRNYMVNTLQITDEVLIQWVREEVRAAIGTQLEPVLSREVSKILATPSIERVAREALTKEIQGRLPDLFKIEMGVHIKPGVNMEVTVHGNDKDNE